MSIRSHHRLWPGSLALLASIGMALGAESPLPGTLVQARAVGSGRPNIIVIQTDDQAYRELKRKVMPRASRLLKGRGTTFTDYIVTTAQCCPSRASLITGQYPHNDGVFSNQDGYSALVDKRNVLPVWLQEAGYRTAHVGKFINGYSRHHGARVAPGWDQWQTLFGGGPDSGGYYGYTLSSNGRRVRFGHRNRDYITRVLNRKAVKLVRRYVRTRKPLYLQLDQRAPHVATGNRAGYCAGHYPEPDPKDTGLFRHRPLPKPPSFNEHSLSDKPAFLRSLPRLNGAQKRKLKRHWRCALESLRSVDRGVADLYRAVKHAGELQRTVFIFTSDNGLFFGEHRIPNGKVLPYEEAVRQPLLIKAPKRYRGGASRVPKIRDAVGNIDLAPTILDLAGAQPCPPTGPCRTMDGRSLMPLLGGSGGWPRARGLLTEYRAPRRSSLPTCEFAGIRTPRTIYVTHTRVINRNKTRCVAADQRERYDLQPDPFELHNLCFGGRPASCPRGARQAGLRLRLSQLRNCAGIVGRDQPVHGRPFCE